MHFWCLDSCFELKLPFFPAFFVLRNEIDDCFTVVQIAVRTILIGIGRLCLSIFSFENRLCHLFSSTVLKGTAVQIGVLFFTYANLNKKFRKTDEILCGIFVLYVM